MDKHFLEFWGNLMLAAARGQASSEAFTTWMTQGAKNADDIGKMFRQFYGLPAGDAPDSSAWETARETYENAFRAYLDLLQVVPRSEFEKLQEHASALEEKVSEQEALIATLRRELRDRLASQGDVARGFEELLQIQSDEFKKLTDNVGEFFGGKKK